MFRTGVARLTPEFRTAVFYSTVFMNVGAATVYAGIWFTDRGLSGWEIGVINAVPVFVMLAVNVLVGRLADRASDWRQVIVIGALAAGILPFGLFFVDGFWGILLFWTLGGVALQSIVPVTDAAVLRMNRRRGSDYGRIRSWGTIGFLVVIFITGYLVTWFGSGIFLPLFAGLALLRALVAFGLPNFRAARDEVPATRGATRLMQVMKPWFLLPLLAWAVVFSTHLSLNAFQALLWKEQGIAENLIGILIALGALSEALTFAFFGRHANRFSARTLILVSAGTSVFRWICMALSPEVAFLFPLQLLHSVTYAVGFLGCLNFIANWTSEDIAAEAQSFSVMLQQVIAIAAIPLFGALVGPFGAHAYFASAAIAAVGAALVWFSIRLKQPKSAQG